jgi:hypothetical protein
LLWLLLIGLLGRLRLASRLERLVQLGEKGEEIIVRPTVDENLGVLLEKPTGLSFVEALADDGVHVANLEHSWVEELVLAVLRRQLAGAVRQVTHLLPQRGETVIDAGHELRLRSTPVHLLEHCLVGVVALHPQFVDHRGLEVIEDLADLRRVDGATQVGRELLATPHAGSARLDLASLLVEGLPFRGATLDTEGDEVLVLVLVQ